MKQGTPAGTQLDCAVNALFAGEHFVDVLLHALLDPGLQVRIGQIGDPKGRLIADAVGNERMRRIADDGRQTARNGFEERTAAVEADPSGPFDEKSGGAAVCWAAPGPTAAAAMSPARMLPAMRFSNVDIVAPSSAALAPATARSPLRPAVITASAPSPAGAARRAEARPVPCECRWGRRCWTGWPWCR